MALPMLTTFWLTWPRAASLSQTKHSVLPTSSSDHAIDNPACDIMVLSKEEQLIDISDRLCVMRRQEADHYVVPDYLAAEWQQKLLQNSNNSKVEERSSLHSSSAISAAVASSHRDISQNIAVSSSSNDNDSSAPSSSQINELWREKICEWSYQVVDHFGKLFLLYLSGIYLADRSMPQTN